MIFVKSLIEMTDHLKSLVCKQLDLIYQKN